MKKEDTYYERMRTLDSTSNIYNAAFGQETAAIWSGTPFEAENEDINYARALTAWVRNDPGGESDRKELLYYYCSKVMATDEADDPLNKYRKILPSDNSIIMRALRNLCIAYNEAPVRHFKRNGEPYKLSNTLHNVINTTGYDRAMQRNYRLAKLCNEVLVRPKVVGNRIVHKTLSPELYRCAYSDDTLTEVWIPHQRTVGGRLEWHYGVWTIDDYRVLNRYLVDATPPIANNYGRIPYEFLTMDESSIYGGSLWELCSAVLQCNRLTFSAEENILYNGFAVWMFTNFDIKGKLKVTPGRAFIAEDVRVGEGELMPPAIETAQPMAQYIEIDQYKNDLVKNTLRNLGLPNSVINDTAGLQSGVALLIDRFELDEIRREDLNVLRPFEERYINLMINQLNVDTDINLDQDIQLSIDYSDMQMFIEPSEKLNHGLERAKNGLISPKQLYSLMTDDDTIETDEEAVNIILTNKALWKKMEDTDVPNDS